ncbi:acyclic terpene utilization AtuA family protein [Dyella sp. A6]|uniref:acyclic terpene utilization AtuA family protein n=1 Tax=Dyella aluminiiresistens TaxID=3069105 RepID=UPI002E7A691B|nr:acyclic terpene utilization AtuA family protein [Dyella sp. A6]
MTSRPRTLRLGSGAGYSGDRIEPAVELAEYGNIDYLIFECLAERTIAQAQMERLHYPERGFDPLLEERMRRVLPHMHDASGARRFRIITNMGAANPQEAARVVCRVAAGLGIHGLKVATVTGDDVLEQIRQEKFTPLDNGTTPFMLGERLVSANVYLGAEGMVRALQQGADVVITGRVADPALFLAPQVLEFGLSWSDWGALGKATVVGHLLECAGQITGGYFADPGFKDVSGLARLGFPIAEVSESGRTVITKVAGSGGCVTQQTCAEQLVYEIHDPSAYITPDVTADFSTVAFEQEGIDRVVVHGGGGSAKPERLKVSVGYLDGYVGEGQISYGGPGALSRGELARQVVLERLRIAGVKADAIRSDLIGVDALYGGGLERMVSEPPEIRLRVAARCATPEDALRIGREVEALYTNGPAGGGGATKTMRQSLAIASMLWPADHVQIHVHMEISP